MKHLFKFILLFGILLLPSSNFATKPKIIVGPITIVNIKHGDSAEDVKIKHVIETSTITWVRYTEFKKLREACGKLGLHAKKGWVINACSSFDLAKNTCTIHALIPKHVNGDLMKYLGHEALHCFVGSFHDEVGIKPRK